MKMNYSMGISDKQEAANFSNASVKDVHLADRGAVERSNSKFVLIGFLLLLIGGVGGYFAGVSTKKPQSVQETAKIQVTVSPALFVQEAVVSDKPMVSNGALQEIMNKKCISGRSPTKQPTPSHHDYPYGHISLNDLPFTIDQSVAKIDFEYDGYLNCIGLVYNSIDKTTNGSIGISLANKRSVVLEGLVVYDDFSQGPDRGGPPWLGSWESFGKVVMNNNGLKLVVYLQEPWGHFYLGKDTVRVFLRATKEVRLSNGGIVYVSLTDEVIPATDSRVIAILKKYSVPSIDYAGAVVLNSASREKAQDEIVNTYFSDMKTLANPEKDAVSYVERIMNAIEAK
jgi:hypothetical protein